MVSGVSWQRAVGKTDSGKEERPGFVLRAVKAAPPRAYSTESVCSGFNTVNVQTSRFTELRESPACSLSPSGAHGTERRSDKAQINSQRDSRAALRNVSEIRRHLLTHRTSVGQHVLYSPAVSAKASVRCPHNHSSRAEGGSLWPLAGQSHTLLCKSLESFLYVLLQRSQTLLRGSRVRDF